MIHNSVRGQASAGTVFFAIFFVIAMGFILIQFTSSIDTVRINLLNSLPADKVIMHLFLYILMPLIYVCYLVLSAFTIIMAARAVG